MIAIGASAGGPAALARMLSTLPRDFPAAIVIVQHVDVQFAPGLADWLASQTALPVRLAQEGDRPEAGHGASWRAGPTTWSSPAPPGWATRASRKTRPTGRRWTCSSRASAGTGTGSVVGVLLTGMGRDGAEGLQAAARPRPSSPLRRTRPLSAVYGMPKAAAELERRVRNFSAGQNRRAAHEYGDATYQDLMHDDRNENLVRAPPGLQPSPEYHVMVLLVDDQAMVCEAVRRALANEPDIDFHYCADAREALAAATQIKPTVILQDLVMPGIDGLTLVGQFRANPATQDIPIIVLSTNENPQVKGQAFAIGANDYLVKLPDKIELIARIRYHSRAFINQLQRDAAYRALRESQQQLIESNAQLLSLNQQARGGHCRPSPSSWPT